MAAIGSLVFCTDCGNLLDGGAGKQNAILTCQVCGASCKGMSAKLAARVFWKYD
jgi:DNA-directed RNA polymerase I subunit RPA12